jgi:predicted DNA binding protein
MTPDPLSHPIFRAKEEEAQGDRQVIAKVEFRIPPDVWLSQLSVARPELRILVLHTEGISDELSLGTFEIEGALHRDLSSEISACTGVHSVERLDGVGMEDRYRVKYLRPPLLSLTNQLQVLICYPRIVEVGRMSCQIIDRRSRVREFVEGLRRFTSEVRIVQLKYRQLRITTPDLTHSQHELFRRALAAGYFDVPRRVTLRQLAHRVSRSPSSVSESLAKVEKKLAEAADLSGP